MSGIKLSSQVYNQMYHIEAGMIRENGINYIPTRLELLGITMVCNAAIMVGDDTRDIVIKYAESLINAAFNGIVRIEQCIHAMRPESCDIADIYFNVYTSVTTHSADSDDSYTDTHTWRVMITPNAHKGENGFHKGRLCERVYCGERMSDNGILFPADYGIQK